MTSFRTPRLQGLKLLFALLSFVISGLAAWAMPVSFNIPASAAPAALKLFNKQSSKPAIFIYDDLKAVMTNEVVGEMEPAAALEQLLKGTGLEITQTTEKNFVIGKSSQAKHSTGSVRGTLAKGLGVAAEDIRVMIRETGQQARTDKNGEFFFSSVEPGTYLLVVTADGYQPLHITDVVVKAGSELSLSREEMHTASGTLELEPVVVRAESVFQLEKVEVTDSRPKPFSDRNVDLPRTVNDVQPYYIFDSQKIEESGTTDVEDFLRQRLTMNTTVQMNSQRTLYQPGASNGAYPSTTSSINLNGLGVDHTLILVNGLPMAGLNVITGGSVSNGGLGQFGQPDVNGIPLGAIERIEVLPSSAGAIYGPRAEGGVINIVIKKAYTGGDITTTYASTWDGHGPSRTLEVTFGKSFEHGKLQLFVTAQYSDQSPMFVGDRINLLNRGYGALSQNDPSFLGFLSNSSIDNRYTAPLGATPNFATNITGYPVPAGTPGVSAGDQTHPIGFITGSGLPTTAANPWQLFVVQPLTLKSTGVALGGANPYIATLPVGYSATSNPASIIGGQWNLGYNPTNEGPNGLLVPLGNYPRRKSVFATVTRQMSSTLQLHLDYSYSENHAYSNFNPINGNITLAPADPINPFNQQVQIAVPINFSAPATSNAITNSFTLGGTLKLPIEWIAHLDYQWSEGSVHSQFVIPLATSPFNDGRFGATTFYGVNSSNTFLGVPDLNPLPTISGAVNPVTDTVARPLDLAPYSENFFYRGKNTLNDLVFAASGPLFHLPWGDPRLSIRLEHNKTDQLAGPNYEELPYGTLYPGLPLTNSDLRSFTSFPQSQSTDSANVELDVPIFKSKLPLLRSLDAQFNFSGLTSTNFIATPGIFNFPPYAYGSYPNGATLLVGPNSISTSPQPLAAYTDQNGNLVPASNAQPIRIETKNTHTSITGPALSYKPTDDILLRGSIAEGYVPPTYAQLLPNSSVLGAPSNTTINDPKTGTSYKVTVYNLTGNPDLKPTTSKSWDLGAIWAPSTGFLKGLRVDAEFVETKQYNLILSPGAQTLINFEGNFPSLVVRDATTGQITSVYNQYINVAEAKQDAWTYTVDYNRVTPIGAFELTAAETIQEHVQQQLVTGTNFLEFVGFPSSGGVGKTKSTGTLRWARHNWVAAWTVVNFGGYSQHGAPGDPGSYATPLEKGQTYTLNTQYTLAQGGNTIPSQTYHNLYLSYTFSQGTFDRGTRWGRWTDAFLSGMKVSLAVNNVFNTLPPFDAYYQPFYTSPYGDVQLRNYSISLKKSF